MIHRIVLVGWEEMQHYSTRATVPWIKLHRELLTDTGYRRLSPGARALLIDLWLLATEEGTGVILLDRQTVEHSLAWLLRERVNAMQSRLAEIEAVRDADGVARWVMVERDLTAGARPEQLALAGLEAGTSVAVLHRAEEAPKTPSLRAVTLTAKIAEVLAEVAEGRRQKLTREERRNLAASWIFSYHSTVTGRPNARLDRNGIGRLIVARLAENEDCVDELLFAADGQAKSPYHRGHNDRGQTYLTADLCYRSRAHVERFSEYAKYKPGMIHPVGQQITEELSAAMNGDHPDA